MPFLIFQRDHLRSTSGIVCGSGSFAVQIGDHFRSGDHLRSGIICGAVQVRRQCDAVKFPTLINEQNFCRAAVFKTFENSASLTILFSWNFKGLVFKDTCVIQETMI